MQTSKNTQSTINHSGGAHKSKNSRFAFLCLGVRIIPVIAAILPFYLVRTYGIAFATAGKMFGVAAILTCLIGIISIQLSTKVLHNNTNTAKRGMARGGLIISTVWFTIFLLSLAEHIVRIGTGT